MIDEQLLADLRQEEGWRAHAYQDHRGYWTIGFGFLIDSRRGGGLPKHVGDLWLEWIVYDRQREIERRAPWVAAQPPEVQRALLLMAYQMGVAGLFGFGQMLAALQRGDRAEAARQALDSAWWRDEKTRARAERVAALIRGPVPD